MILPLLIHARNHSSAQNIATSAEGALIILSNNHRKTPNISCILVGNKIVDHSDVVGASPVGAAPTTSSFLS